MNKLIRLVRLFFQKNYNQNGEQIKKISMFASTKKNKMKVMNNNFWWWQTYDRMS
jgi:hypothetical protein